MTERLDISTKHCTIERDGRVVILTMNRPEKRNALSPDMLAGLVLGYEYVDEDPEIRCAILTGAGGSFCSGMDLTSMGQQSEDPNVQAVMARGNNPHWKALLRDYRLSKPLIAAVEGYAVAGGSEILQGTDIRVAGESAIFGVWEAKRGPVPARRFGVPAAPPDPVHDRDGHPVALPAGARARGARDRPHRPRRPRRPGARRGRWSSRRRSPRWRRCRRRRSCGRGARPRR